MILKFKQEKRSYRAVLGTALFIIAQLVSGQVSAAEGVWVTREYAADSSAVEKVVNFCDENNIRDIYFQIRGRGDAFYKSRFLAKSSIVKPADFDPLEYICRIAEPKNIRINAWFNTYIIYSNAWDEPATDHIINLFPEWTCVDKFGISDRNIAYHKTRNKFFEGTYLSPVHPKVNQYLFILVREIIENYPVDGIHFDYIRFQNRDFGFNPEGRAVFRRETGLDPADYMSGADPEKRKLPEGMFFELYDSYRTEAVNELLIRVKRYTSDLLLPPKISAAVKSRPQEALHQYFQDWPRWLEENWIDYVVVMNYQKYATFSRDLEAVYNRFDDNMLSRIYCGIGVWKLTPAEARRQKSHAEELGFINTVYFSYKTFDDDPGYLRKMRR